MAIAHLEHITAEELARYGVVAAPDILTGTPADNKAVFDRLVAAMVAPKVNAMIDVENLLIDAENGRTQAEAGRVEAENARVKAEHLRGAAETARAEAEALRVTAEQARAAAESLRGNTEEARKAAETARVNAEAARVAAEVLRAKAEEARAAAEGLRVEAERGRVSAETGRAGSEAARVTAEGLRAAEEGKRVSGEQGRNTAEGLRGTAEERRAANESTRTQQEEGRRLSEGERVTAEGLRRTAEDGRVLAERGRATAEEERTATEEARNVWEGYDPAKPYVPGNKVVYQGSSYLCIADSVGHLPSDGTYWRIIAQKGADGEGAGDMREEIYDPTGKRRDVFQYTDEAVQELKGKPVLTGGIPVIHARIVLQTVSSNDYAAEAAGITELTDGLTIRMIPTDVGIGTRSSLNLNGLGIKFIARSRSNDMGATEQLLKLSAGVPVELTYSKAKDVWMASGLAIPVAADILGVVLPKNGGVPQVYGEWNATTKNYVATLTTTPGTRLDWGTTVVFQALEAPTTEKIYFKLNDTYRAALVRRIPNTNAVAYLKQSELILDHPYMLMYFAGDVYTDDDDYATLKSITGWFVESCPKYRAKDVGISYVYQCTGVADDVAISKIVNDFMAAQPTYTNAVASMKLVVSGTLGLSTEPQFGLGTGSDPFCYFLFKRNASATGPVNITIDWSNANWPQTVRPSTIHGNTIYYSFLVAKTPNYTTICFEGLRADIDLQYHLSTVFWFEAKSVSIRNSDILLRANPEINQSETVLVQIHNAEVLISDTYIKFIAGDISKAVGIRRNMVSSKAFRFVGSEMYMNGNVTAALEVNDELYILYSKVYIVAALEDSSPDTIVVKATGPTMGRIIGSELWVDNGPNAIILSCSTSEMCIEASHLYAHGSGTVIGIRANLSSILSMSDSKVEVRQDAKWDSGTHGIFATTGNARLSNCDIETYGAGGGAEGIRVTSGKLNARGCRIRACCTAPAALGVSVGVTATKPARLVLEGCSFLEAGSGYVSTKNLEIGAEAKGFSITGCDFSKPTVGIGGSEVTYITPQEGKYMPQFANQFGTTGV